MQGQTAEQYLRTSNLDPKAYIVPGFAANGMYQDFAKVLTDRQLNDLVAYLLTLKQAARRSVGRDHKCRQVSAKGVFA